jgi:DNA repair exonuclease SbcCD nuclease subunit
MYSDLHIREETTGICETVLDKIHEIALENKVDYILNGGDTFNTRGIIRTSCLDILYRHYKKWFDSGLKQIILVGNHDQEDKKGEIHPMKIFESFNGWKVIDQPQTIDGIKNTLFCPYMSKKDVHAYLHSPLKKAAGDWRSWDAFVHWGVCGAKRNDSNTDTDGVLLDWLENFRNVFSGHYHFRNSIQNVHYIGSPYQQNFGEMGQNKGVIIYDNKENKKEHYAIKDTPRHYEVAIEWDEKGKRIVKGFIKDIGKKDHVRFKVFGDSEQCSKISSENSGDIVDCDSVKIERFVKEKHLSRLDIKSDDVLSPQKLVEKYIDFVDTSLDKRKLLKLGLEILR